MKKLTFTYILLVCLFLCGCAREDLSQLLGNNGVETIPVKLSFMVPSVTNTPVSYDKQDKAPVAMNYRTTLNKLTDSIMSGQSRSANQDSPIYNLYVFQFDKNGNKVTVSKIDETPAPVDSRITLSVKLAEGTDQTIYLVALGKQCDINLLDVKTKTELEEYKISYMQLSEGVYTSKIKSDEDIPYSGYADGIEIIKLKGQEEGAIKYDPASEFDGGIRLKCLVAKLSLYFKYDVTNYVLTGILLKNIPDKFGINPEENAGEKYVELNAVTANDITETDPETGYSVVSWYIAPNMQGENTAIISESDRYVNNAPANASYFEVWANKKNSKINYAIYSIYIGGNNTSNFDIKANGHYKLYTEFNIVPEEKDFRIKLYALEQFTYLSNYDFDSHYDRRPITIVATRKQVTIEILDPDTNMPVGNDCWLKVSYDDNYTDAYNNGTLGIQASRTIVVPSQIKFWLYSDEYVEPDAPNRSVKVRIITKGLDDLQTATADYTISQRAIVSVGRLGGDFDETTGQYTKQLGLSSIDEYSQAYNKKGDITSSALSGWGYYGVSTRTAGYGTDDFNNGKIATKNLAENPADLVVNNGVAKIPQPIKKNGKIDLYQYSYYDVYAARFCYDRNRDLNGDGQIKEEDGELKWYLPSFRQVMGIAVQQSSPQIRKIIINNGSVIMASTYEGTNDFAGYASINATRTDLYTTTSSGKNGSRAARCVRDID